MVMEHGQCGQAPFSAVPSAALKGCRVVLLDVEGLQPVEWQGTQDRDQMLTDDTGVTLEGLPRDTWRATGNALEGVAEAHNHSLLCLDELSQLAPAEAGEISYLLANGRG